MFSKISNGLLGWINRTEIPSNHQPPSTFINDQLIVFPSENNAKAEADKNGNCGGTKLEDRVITEILREEKKEVNEVMKLTQKEFVVVCDEKLEKDRAFRFPVMPESKDCSSYLQTGFCFSGSNCKLNHPPNWRPQVEKVKEIAGSLDTAAQEVKKKNDSKAEKIDCKYFGSPGGCKSGKASKVNHNTKPYPTVQFNFMGLPIRQGVRDCSFYMSNGSCKHGVTCWFNHPDPMSVGEYDNHSGDSSQTSILLSNASQSTSGSCSPLALSETPPYVPFMFPSTQGVTSLSEWNAYQAPVYQPERSMQQASAYSTNSQPLERNVAEFPERTGQPECNNFLKTGYCKYMSACKFHHPNNEIAKSTSSALGDSSLPPAVQPLIKEPVVSTSCDASFTQKNIAGSFVLNVRKSKAKQSMPVPKEQNANQNLRCEVCTSIQLYKNHTYGKKHTNNLQKLQAEKKMSQTAQASQSTNAGKTRMVIDLERKEHKCLRGRTAVHSLTEQAHVAKANLGPTLPTNPIPKSSEKITGKPMNGEDLVVHKEGKKHQTYVEKSQNPKVDPTCLASAKPTFKEPEDVETKIRKVLESGVPEDSVRTCTICSVVCNSEITLKSHLAGQKHAALVKEKQAEEEVSITKNLTVNEPSDKISSSGETSIQSGKSMAGDTSMVTDLKEKDHKHLEGGIEVQFLKECAVCNVLYSGEVEFVEHLTGKKHLAQVGALTTKSEPNPNSETIPRPDSTEKIYTEPKKDESLWCEFCEIRCTRVEDLIIHKGGKKHKTMVEELQNPKTVDPASPEDSKPKIQKVLNCGEAESVKICTICSVMCKSETLFNAHMAGKRHANMVKKKQAQEISNATLRCEVCNINCTSIQLYKNHTYGKKHTNNLQKLQAEKKMSQTAQASQSQSTDAGKTRMVTDLERKEQKLPRGRTAVHSLTEIKELIETNGKNLPYRFQGGARGFLLLGDPLKGKTIGSYFKC